MGAPQARTIPWEVWTEAVAAGTEHRWAIFEREEWPQRPGEAGVGGAAEGAGGSPSQAKLGEGPLSAVATPSATLSVGEAVLHVRED